MPLRSTSKKTFLELFTACTDETAFESGANEWEGKVRTIINGIQETKKMIIQENNATKAYNAKKFSEILAKQDELVKMIKDIKN